MNSTQTPTAEESFELKVRDTLFENHGNVLFTARALGKSRLELFEYIRTRPNLFLITTDARDGLCDAAEHVLRKALNKEKKWATELIFETIGSDRLEGFMQSFRPDSFLQPIRPDEVPDLTLIPQVSRLTITEQTRFEDLEHKQKTKPVKQDKKMPEVIEKLDRAGGNVIETIWKYIGDLRAAGKRLGVTRQQLIDYIMLRPDLQAALHSKREELIDLCEATLHDLVEKEIPWVIKFVLTTLGRHRGYCYNRRSRRARGLPRPVEETPIGVPDNRRLTPEELEEFERLNAIVAGKVSPTNPDFVLPPPAPAAAAPPPTAQAPSPSQRLAGSGSNSASQPAKKPSEVPKPEPTRNQTSTNDRKDQKVNQTNAADRKMMTSGLPDKIDLSKMNRRDRRKVMARLRKKYGEKIARWICDPNRSDKPPEDVPKTESSPNEKRPPPDG